ncbi:transglutaminase domain-containing protein [Paenibacillus spiritus]|uniref:Transglutaminase domain-containing protein n=1 Tax=Paenibacillus spiritus TaxID=2496557 RepID=A0A5J5FUT4_9BACL|nr:transglutaminase-like domain-containing protein [Paenibacillus spiritus]KAA8997127.1 transglutaminase domain-containing protein [Paenibacillus spiritus]
MNKKWYSMLLAGVIGLGALPLVPSSVQASADWMDTSKVSQGVVGVQYDVTPSVRTKVMITKDGKSYNYTLPSDSEEWFPLQQGNGSYQVSVLENTSGNKYKLIFSETVSLSLSNPNAAYLGSVQNIKWDATDKSIQIAKELTKNASTDMDKVKLIYNYVVDNIKYDYTLAANLPADYIPNIENTLSSKKGICYDYSALFAAMLRSVGVPTKLVMGSSDYVKEYHAWNEVMVGGTWITIDTTVDAGLAKSKKSVALAKSSSKYAPAKVY